MKLHTGLIITGILFLQLAKSEPAYGRSSDPLASSDWQQNSPLHPSTRHTRSIVGPEKAVLLDTTELTSLGWTKYPEVSVRMPGWAEESFTNFERNINWRSIVVCDVGFDSVNNWLWTPYIERGNANRLYIEIKFTMRDCNLFPNKVRSCKETFSLLYKETDEPMGTSANASFAQADSFQLIDAVAADEGRSNSNSDVVINTEVRSVAVSRRGVYFAFRDQGACLSLISIRVYSLACPETVSQLARFPATPTGRDLTSLVAVEGQCVANALSNLADPPRLICTADGQWNSVAAGQCHCLEGYEPASSLNGTGTGSATECQPCAPGTFKASRSAESRCSACPRHSAANQLGSSECRCLPGYFRGARDPRSAPCTQPPGPPTNLSLVYVDADSLILQWQEPANTGGRDDITYRLVCDNCDPQTTISSPAYNGANFSENRCVLAGLAPHTAYRLRVYAMNGVSHLASSNQQPQFSGIQVHTHRPQPQTTSNTLSSQGGFQLLPIYNFRALAGARATEMLLAWDAQPLALTSADSAGGAPPSTSGGDPGTYLELPALYEVRYQAKSALDARRLPYPASLMAAGEFALQQQQQSVSSTSRAILINSLVPQTTYVFQIRAKWSHSSGQWSELSEPIYATTGSAPPASSYPTSGSENSPSQEEMPPPPSVPAKFGQPFAAVNNFQSQPAASGSSWSGGSSLLMGLAMFGSLLLAALALLHYRRNMCGAGNHSAGGSRFGAAGFGYLSSGSGACAGPASTYGGLYADSSVPSLEFGGPHGRNSPGRPHAQLMGNHQQLIAGPNQGAATCGRPGLVQSFIAATLGQIGGHLQAAPKQHPAPHHHQTMDGKQLFANAHHITNNHHHHQQQQQPLPRNHYHQTLSMHQQQQPPNGTLPHHLNLNLNQPGAAEALLKYRTLGQPGAQMLFGQQVQQQQQQQHIYDDLETVPSARAHNCVNEIDPERIIIDSVIGRGEFGEVCLASLKLNGSQETRQVAVKTLRAQASDKARLDFLVEASIMGQFEHPNIIRLEGVVTQREPFMIVTELMEQGSLDSYLRENKGRLGSAQLVAMLRGIAHGMQYLSELNYVHKDLAARNILINSELECKIADFGLSAHQSAASEPLNPMPATTANYTADSTSSSNTLSSHTTGGSGTPTTTSTLLGGAVGGPSTNLQQMANQIVQQRFSHQAGPMNSQPASQASAAAIQNPKIPIRWTALEAIAFKRFTSASDVWSFGVVCWEVMSEGERPYWSWSNQDVIKAVEQGYRLPQPENCPEPLYKLMLDCWLKDRLARPTFAHIVKSLDRLLNHYDDPYSLTVHQQQQQQQQHPQLVPLQSRVSGQSSNNIEPNYYDTYSQLIAGHTTPASNQAQLQLQPQAKLASVEDWLQSLDMSRYLENFQRHQINSLQYVSRLSGPDLNLIGIKNSQHVKKLSAAIAALRSTTSIGASGEGFLV